MLPLMDIDERTRELIINKLGFGPLLLLTSTSKTLHGQRQARMICRSPEPLVEPLWSDLSANLRKKMCRRGLPPNARSRYWLAMCEVSESPKLAGDSESHSDRHGESIALVRPHSHLKVVEKQKKNERVPGTRHPIRTRDVGRLAGKGAVVR